MSDAQTSERPLLKIENVTKQFGGEARLFGGRAPAAHALQGVSLSVRKGETLGIVGESGCGKSTLARMLVGLSAPSRGDIQLDGRDFVADAKADPRAAARRVQYVFQDPVASLNPRKTIRATLEAPLIHLRGLDRSAREERLAELREAVSLASDALDRYPHEFSGGQAQRIAIARALAAEPEILVLDEPVSALDVSVQAQILNLLDDLKRRFELTYIFISHDLSVVESVSDRVAVMYFGRIVEIGPARALFAAPKHPYTELLMRSAPAPGRRRLSPEAATAELPDPFHPPKGCAFLARCPRGDSHCGADVPPLSEGDQNSGHFAACRYPGKQSE